MNWGTRRPGLSFVVGVRGCLGSDREEKRDVAPKKRKELRMEGEDGEEERMAHNVIAFSSFLPPSAASPSLRTLSDRLPLWNGIRQKIIRRSYLSYRPKRMCRVAEEKGLELCEWGQDGYISGLGKEEQGKWVWGRGGSDARKGDRRKCHKAEKRYGLNGLLTQRS